MRRVFTAIHRQRIRFAFACGLLILASTPLMSRLPTGWPSAVAMGVYVIGVLGLIMVVGTVLFSARLRTAHPAVVVRPPVDGRWLAMNSPASRVPSHGVRLYGQAHAIDLVYEPGLPARPAFGSGRGMRPAADFPGFGLPVRAMADGVVVAVSDRQRDHRSRSNWFAVIYMMFAGALREFGGPRFIVGNHVTVRIGDGVYSLVAHLKQGSALVRVGDRVEAGQPLGECGNSGNSSEPHVHAQLMDRAALWTAQGIPFEFEHARVPPVRDTSQENPDFADDADTRVATMPRSGEFLETT